MKALSKLKQIADTLHHGVSEYLSEEPCEGKLHAGFCEGPHGNKLYIREQVAVSSTRQTLLILMIFSVAASNAWACNRTENDFFCEDDIVTITSGWTGIVSMANLWDRKVRVRWWENERGNHVSPKRNGIYKSDRLALHLGCVSEYCVDDIVIGPDGWSGTVIGVNPHRDQVAVSWGTRGNGSRVSRKGTWEIRNLALQLGCISGHCVGDTVEYNHLRTGTIVGVNPRRGEVAIRQEYTSETKILFDIYSLWNIKHSDDYGSHERSHESYPVLDKDLMISDTFKFSLERPVQEEHDHGGACVSE